MRIFSKGQVTMPRLIREAKGFHPGTDRGFTMDEEGIVRVVRGTGAPPSRQ